jgi:putative ABC transport system substrate-binding protein
MSRRDFCGLFGSVLTPGIAIAQALNVLRRIAILEPANLPGWMSEGATAALRARGWIEGENLYVERRYFVGSSDALETVARELVSAKFELIVTTGTRATLAVKGATTTIPIVFDSAGDPVLLGLVDSLARPGGNVTGYSMAAPEVATKTLSVLKELLPRLRHVGVLQEAGNPFHQATRRQFEQVFESLGLVPIIVEVEPGRIAASVEQLTRQEAEALILDGAVGGSEEIIDAATKRGLPTLAANPAMVRTAGALIAYSPTFAELWARRAEYIDRILRGAKPADLPVQQPTRFELVINAGTAKALGVTIPQSLRLRADEVIR